MSYRKAAVARIVDFFQEAAEAVNNSDPAQGVVAIRTDNAIYFGRVHNADADVVVLDTLPSDGPGSAHPLHVVTETIRAFRYVDLEEATGGGSFRNQI